MLRRTFDRRDAIASCVVPVLEQLEGRRLLSVALTDNDGDGIRELALDSSNVSDAVTIWLDPAGGNTVIKENAAVYTYAEEFESMDLSTHLGNDVLKIYVMSDFEGDRLSIAVDLGDGTDQFQFSSAISGSTPASTVSGDDNVSPIAADADGGDLYWSNLVLEVEGLNGNDSISMDLSRTTIDGSAVIFNADGGAGSDVINFNTPDWYYGEDGVVAGSGPASRVVANINVGSGTTNTVNLIARTDIEGGSEVETNIEGGSGADIVNAAIAAGVFYDDPGDTSPSGSEYALSAVLGAGNDQFTATMDFSGGGIIIGEKARIEIDASGGDGGDKLRVQDSDDDASTSSDILGVLDVALLGGNGNDSVVMDLDPDAELAIADGGTVRGLLSGDAGSDTVKADMTVSLAEYAQLELAVLGGSNNDNVIASVLDVGLFNGGTSDNYGVYGAVLVDGGRNHDKWDTEGNALFDVRAAEQYDDTLEPPNI